jgi:glycosyltransferase involved in cell wall biosynthesis
MKILYIHQHFTFPSGAGGARSYYLAKKLVDEGHDVTMLCGGIEGSDTGLASALLIQKTKRDGIGLIKVNVPYSNKQSFMRRIWSFLKFVIVASKVSFGVECDLIYATSTPLTVGVLPLLNKLFRRKKYIFEVRDLWPEVPASLGIIRNPLLLKALYAFEKMIYRYSECCVGLSPGMVAGIVSASPNKQVYLLPNACDNHFFADVANKQVDIYKALQKKEGEFWVGYTGSHGMANGLDAVLDVAAIVKSKGYNHIKFILVGDGAKKVELVGRAKEEQLDNCVFLDTMPKPQLKQIYGQLDLGLMVLLNNRSFYEGSSPNKFFDYLACGLPVIVNYPGWMARVIEHFEIGLSTPPEMANDFSDKIIVLSKNENQLKVMARNTKKAREFFAREAVAAKFVSVVTNAQKPSVNDKDLLLYYALENNR